MRALRKPGASPKLRRTRLAELLLEVSNKIAVASDLAEAFEVLAHYTASVLDSETASVFLHDARTGELYTRIQKDRAVREVRIQTDSGVAGHVFTNGRGANVGSAYSDDRFNPDVD